MTVWMKLILGICRTVTKAEMQCYLYCKARVTVISRHSKVVRNPDHALNTISTFPFQLRRNCDMADLHSVKTAAVPKEEIPQVLALGARPQSPKRKSPGLGIERASLKQNTSHVLAQLSLMVCAATQLPSLSSVITVPSVS